MKFKHFEHLQDKTWIHVLPAVIIKIDDLSYREKNIALEIHIIIWHFRWFWCEERTY